VAGARKQPVKIQAKANIEATAKYSVKKTVTQRIPDDVTRARASAWLTILSPITEWAGLKGDELRYKRELLRIHREETLTAIMRRAAPGLAKIRRPIGPVPMKFLVPFLENASLEEVDSELMQMWAGLLVSSAGNYSGDNVYYVRLLSQMSSQQALVFEKIIGGRSPSAIEDSLTRMSFEFRHDFLAYYLKSCFEQAKRKPRSLVSAWTLLHKSLNISGLVVEHIDLGRKDVEDEYTSGPPTYSIYQDNLDNDFAILAGLGLLKRTDTGYLVLNGQWDVKVLAYYLSPLGSKFAQACAVGAG